MRSLRRNRRVSYTQDVNFNLQQMYPLRSKRLQIAVYHFNWQEFCGTWSNTNWVSDLTWFVRRSIYDWRNAFGFHNITEVPSPFSVDSSDAE